jgi:tRNA(Arg) A34 adenosine deaminase TadA
MVTPELAARAEGSGLRDREQPTQEERTRLAVEPSRLDEGRRTGGSFGVSLFDPSANRLVAPETYLAVPSRYAAAHAEMTAIMIAQQAVGNFDERRSCLSGPSPSKRVASMLRGSTPPPPCCGRIDDARHGD